MSFRSFSSSVIAGVVFVSGCSAGGGLQQSTLPQSRAVQALPITAQNDSASASTHFLYVAGFNILNVYALPLTAASKPAHTISGFTDAAAVTVGTTNINVLDVQNPAAGLDVFFASGPNKFKKRCSIPYPSSGASSIVYHSDALYLVTETPGEVSRFADTESSTGTPQPCNGEKPVNDTNALASPAGVGANGKFVYVADETKKTLGAYPVPLTAGEPAKFSVKLSAIPSGVVASDTDVYVSFAGSGFIEDFKLPLRDTSVPIKLQYHVFEQPAGLALFPRPTVSPPTELFVSDEASGAIYTFKLPITSSSVPLVTTLTSSNTFGMDAK